MKNKTCGECIFYHCIREDAGICALTDEFEQTCDFVYSCKSFLPAPPQTKGDKARQMGNTELAITMFRLAKCEECPCDKSKCRCIRTAQCLDNWAEYFNAPANAPDINVGTKESEVENDRSRET